MGLRFLSVDESAAGHMLTRNKKENHTQMDVIFFFVAGSGIEPESGGYEPPEVPLL